ncbi:hypothetical protein HYT26_03995, partial [Candidatus Pacearchaeota archaeon]|nr:hypothetical protein [Candidatus Pacearchaeota archaeon]
MKVLIKVFIVLAIVLVLVIAVFLIKPFINGINGAPTKSTQTATTPATPITYSNIEQQLSQNSMVKALPDDAALLLRFYNFGTGERQWEKSYVLKKAYVKEMKEGAAENEKTDIILSMHSKYLKKLTNRNLCSVIKNAKANGDLGFDTALSTAQLLWKKGSATLTFDIIGIL